MMRQKNFVLCIIYTVSLLLFGGFYAWNITALGVLVCLGFGSYLHGKKQGFHGASFWIHRIPAGIFLFQIVVTFWAVDKTAHLQGIIQGAVLLIWMRFCFQKEEYERACVLDMIPGLGCCMVIICGACYFLPTLGRLFWRADRLGGFFQYANTCALFFLLGLVILSGKWSEGIPDRAGKDRFIAIFQLLILTVGILLTGSRSILLLTVFWGIYKGIGNRRFRKYFLGILLPLLVFMLMVYFLTGEGTQNITRIFTVFTSSSTLWGRLLYDIDGISMLAAHPMGLGYSGYYYVQHALQTGVYTTRFVHNDFLQMGLDYGIFPMILFAAYIVWQIVWGKQSKKKKELLALIALASLADFHLQYLAISFLAVLCLDPGEKVKRQGRGECLENQIGLLLLAVTFAVLTVPYFAAYRGNYEMTLKFLPCYTDGLVDELKRETDKDKAVELAENILSHNAYLSYAYNVKGFAAMMDGDLEGMMECQDQVLLLERYDIDRYRIYDELLQQYEQQLLQILPQKDGESKEETIRQIEAKRENIKAQLLALREITNPIAYRLRDVPQYKW